MPLDIKCAVTSDTFCKSMVKVRILYIRFQGCIKFILHILGKVRRDFPRLHVYVKVITVLRYISFSFLLNSNQKKTAK